MRVILTDRQKDIMVLLREKDMSKNVVAFDNLENGVLNYGDIDILCNIINEEFLMEGLLPSFEPNEYGMELEDLLDVVNRPRVQP
jgi:hypothetical protein